MRNLFLISAYDIDLFWRGKLKFEAANLPDWLELPQKANAWHLRTLTSGWAISLSLCQILSSQDTATINLTVENQNDAPNISTPQQNLSEWFLPISSHTEDVDALVVDENLFFSGLELPDWLSISSEGCSGVPLNMMLENTQCRFWLQW